MKKQTFKISGMHCTSCSLVIEGELEDLGVKARANYAKQVVEVEFDANKIDEKKIKQVIEDQGYTVLA